MNYTRRLTRAAATGLHVGHIPHGVGYDMGVLVAVGFLVGVFVGGGLDDLARVPQQQ